MARILHAGSQQMWMLGSSDSDFFLRGSESAMRNFSWINKILAYTFFPLSGPDWVTSQFSSTKQIRSPSDRKRVCEGHVGNEELSTRKKNLLTVGPHIDPPEMKFFKFQSKIYAIDSSCFSLWGSITGNQSSNEHVSRLLLFQGTHFFLMPFFNPRKSKFSILFEETRIFKIPIDGSGKKKLSQRCFILRSQQKIWIDHG